MKGLRAFAVTPTTRSSRPSALSFVTSWTPDMTGICEFVENMR